MREAPPLVQHLEPELARTLKQFRLAVGLTQEELAEQAGVSARTVSDAERGLRSVLQPETARRLADALRLERDKLQRFVAIARGHVVSAEAPASPGPGVPVALTPLLGRQEQLETIRATLQRPEGRMLTLTGPGGIREKRLAPR